MDEPSYVSVQRGRGSYEIFERCADTFCRQYHGPIAVCEKEPNANRIVRALTEMDARTEA